MHKIELSVLCNFCKIYQMKPTLLILAAGMGSRYGGLKQISRFGPSGETIIEYSILMHSGPGLTKL
jgi:CTP:molybdopterin cytidylyltransferase MocA